jgi:hypothetical protein
MKGKAFVFVASMLLLSVVVPVTEAAVLRVIVIQTDDLSAYVKEVERGKAIVKRLDGTATIRVWRARFAGPDAGRVVVTLEYPDLAAYVNDDRKASTDPEFQAFLKGIAKMRKIVSDSLYDEQHP